MLLVAILITKHNNKILSKHRQKYKSFSNTSHARSLSFFMN